MCYLNLHIFSTTILKLQAQKKSNNIFFLFTFDFKYYSCYFCIKKRQYLYIVEIINLSLSPITAFVYLKMHTPQNNILKKIQKKGETKQNGYCKVLFFPQGWYSVNTRHNCLLMWDLCAEL